MKYSKLTTWCMAFVLMITWAGCDDEKDLNLNLTEVKTLFTPENNLSVDLQPAQGSVRGLSMGSSPC